LQIRVPIAGFEPAPIAAAIDELPDGFPEATTNSIRAAMSHRIDFLKAD
jgi:hypothetical protein